MNIEQAKVGDKIKFKEERLLYTIRARNEDYLICTKPFNPRHTVLYCIVDLKKQIRGPENLVFGAGAETDEECSQMLSRVSQKGVNQTEVSYRRKLPLNIEKIVTM